MEIKRLEKKVEKKAERYWHLLGPGLTTGGADDDPTAIAAAAQAGARYGTQLLWTDLFTIPLMAVVQEMCARIGIISGQGLAANIRKNYSLTALYGITTLLFFANTFNIAADLAAMAAGAKLLLPFVPVELLVIAFALLCLLLEIFVSYVHYAHYLKYLTLALLSYVVVALRVNLNWSDVLYHTIVPTITFSREQLFLLCSIFGTAISPYLFFWQTSQEVEEEILHGETTVQERKEGNHTGMVRDMRKDVWGGMIFSNVITFFILAATAGTLYMNGGTTIESAAQAAAALAPFGSFAFLLFALGIIGSGLLAVPVLAGSTAYAISESFGWKFGLFRKLKQARAFYGVIIVSTVLGVIANFIHLDPIKGLIYAAAANGIIAPFVLFFVIRISGDRRIMGEYANKPGVALVGWITVAIMGVTGLAALGTLFW